MSTAAKYVDWCRCDQVEGDSPACRYHRPLPVELGQVEWGCSMCGYGSFDRPGQVCEACQRPDGAA
jgi:hypothetical protein